MKEYENEKEEFETISLTPSSASESALSGNEEVAAMYRTHACCVCGFTSTEDQRVFLPCPCQSETDGDDNAMYHDTCLREIIEHSGNLCCPLCGDAYQFEPRVWTGRWAPRRVRWSMRLRCAIEVALSLFVLHLVVLALIPPLQIGTALNGWIVLAISYSIVLTICGGILYVYYVCCMCLHSDACRCSDCRMGHAPLLVRPADQPWLYGLFVIGVPPLVWLFFIAVCILLLQRRARRYYARKVMAAHIVRSRIPYRMQKQQQH